MNNLNTTKIKQKRRKITPTNNNTMEQITENTSKHIFDIYTQSKINKSINIWLGSTEFSYTPPFLYSNLFEYLLQLSANIQSDNNISIIVNLCREISRINANPIDSFIVKIIPDFIYLGEPGIIDEKTSTIALSQAAINEIMLQKITKLQVDWDLPSSTSYAANVKKPVLPIIALNRLIKLLIIADHICVHFLNKNPDYIDHTDFKTTNTLFTLSGIEIIPKNKPDTNKISLFGKQNQFNIFV